MYKEAWFPWKYIFNFFPFFLLNRGCDELWRKFQTFFPHLFCSRAAYNKRKNYSPPHPTTPSPMPLISSHHSRKQEECKESKSCEWMLKNVCASVFCMLWGWRQRRWWCIFKLECVEWMERGECGEEFLTFFLPATLKFITQLFRSHFFNSSHQLNLEWMSVWYNELEIVFLSQFFLHNVTMYTPVDTRYFSKLLSS
jgi:hypothetical protein